MIVVAQLRIEITLEVASSDLNISLSLIFTFPLRVIKKTLTFAMGFILQYLDLPMSSLQ